jgi:cellulose biosynthesis protein BcsQ
MTPLRAFWKYDLFPYVLSGEIMNMDKDGKVQTKEFGPGHWFHPIKILPNEEGLEIHKVLESFEQEYKEAQKELTEKYKFMIIDLAPWMKGNM